MDKFVRKDISREELELLEIESLVNPDVERELKLVNDISKAIEINGNAELKLVLDKIHYQNIKDPKSNNAKAKWVWFSISLILGTVLFFLIGKNVFQETKPKNVYAEYFEPYIPSLSTRGSDNQKRISDFGHAYGQKRYERALSIIEPLLENSNSELTLIAGICAMETQDYKKSNKLFDKVIKSNDYYFLDHAKWYQAMLYLKQKENEKAISLLNELAGDENADHHSQAKSALENI